MEIMKPSSKQYFNREVILHRMFDGVCHIVNYVVSSNVSDYLQADFFHHLMPP